LSDRTTNPRVVEKYDAVAYEGHVEPLSLRINMVVVATLVRSRTAERGDLPRPRVRLRRRSQSAADGGKPARRPFVVAISRRAPSTAARKAVAEWGSPTSRL